jgi:formate hydrogenlyase subunit 6/NADH:ubiquinone oxidoreductase subunit I
MPYLGSAEIELLKHLLKKRATVLYPFEKVDLPPAYRGLWTFDMDKCTGCGLCSRDCPSEAIVLKDTEKTKAGRYPTCYVSRCMFCGQCADVCPTGAIHMSSNYELADYKKKIIDAEAPDGYTYEK